LQERAATGGNGELAHAFISLVGGTSSLNWTVGRIAVPAGEFAALVL
jgi:hypothetical protein